MHSKTCFSCFCIAHENRYLLFYNLGLLLSIFRFLDIIVHRVPFVNPFLGFQTHSTLPQKKKQFVFQTQKLSGLHQSLPSWIWNAPSKPPTFNFSSPRQINFHRHPPTSVSASARISEALLDSGRRRTQTERR